MSSEEVQEAVYAKIEKLRTTARCRCEAINRKVNKLVDDENEQLYACCWVCCDCSIDRMGY
jgi:hypothetical protein